MIKIMKKCIEISKVKLNQKEKKASCENFIVNKNYFQIIKR